MKLLLDQNLAPKLVSRLADLFPDSSHVQSEGLERADDNALWEFARQQGFVIVTKDVDFYNMSVVRGNPPKVIWLLLGNCTADEIEAVFRKRVSDLNAFASDAALGVIALRRERL